MLTTDLSTLAGQRMHHNQGAVAHMHWCGCSHIALHVALPYVHAVLYNELALA